jgi:hypothetical protein
MFIKLTTVRGGFIDLYRLKFTTAENLGWTIHFSDVNSMYPFIALNHKFPVGKYSVIVEKNDLKANITFKDNEFFYRGQSMQGDCAHVSYLAPKNLKRPYLPYRVSDEFSYLALCRKCVVEKITKKCCHKSDNVRSFSSCYQVTDLSKAVSLGYQILEFHELYHYETRDYILRDFVKVLASQKLKYSNILTGVDECDREKFCCDLNTKMCFENDECLRADQVTDNEAQKLLYKQMMNSFFGRFSLHSNFNKHIFVRSLYEISREASRPNCQLVDIFELSDKICQIELATINKIKPSQDGCLYITAEVNSLSRI